MSSVNFSTVIYSATGVISTYVVPATGSYIIEAAGAQGGPGGGPGGRGARIKGTFYFQQGERLHIIVGRQGTTVDTPHLPAGGGGGGSFIWSGASSWPLPLRPLLVAGGGGGGSGGDAGVTMQGGDGAGRGGRDGMGGASDPVGFHYSGGGGAGWLGSGDVGSTPTRCGGGCLWQSGAGANYCGFTGGAGGYGGGGGGAFLGNGSGGGGGYSGGGGGSQLGPHAGGGGSFNAGAHQTNLPGINMGDGYVTITAVKAAVGTSVSGEFDEGAREAVSEIAARSQGSSALAGGEPKLSPSWQQRGAWALG